MLLTYTYHNYWSTGQSNLSFTTTGDETGTVDAIPWLEVGAAAGTDADSVAGSVVHPLAAADGNDDHAPAATVPA